MDPRYAYGGMWAPPEPVGARGDNANMDRMGMAAGAGQGAEQQERGYPLYGVRATLCLAFFFLNCFFC